MGQITTEHCYKLSLRPPHDRVHLSDIKNTVFFGSNSLVATKKSSESLPKNTTLKDFRVLYRVWSRFLTFRKYHTPSQNRELLAH